MRIGMWEFAVSTMAISGLSFAASAGKPEDVYPSRAISIVVGYPPGGGADALARILARHLGRELGKSVVIVNRPGAAGNIGAESVARQAKPDGYTLFLSARPNTIHKMMYANLKFDFMQDLSPVSLIGTSPNVIVTGKHSGIRSVHDLLDRARAAPGKVMCASSGIGTTGYLLCEMFQQEAAINMEHVPYKGSEQGYVDLMGGRVDVLFTTLPAAAPYLDAGTLRGLAIMSQTSTRHPVNLPTMSDLGFPVLDLDAWAGLMAPAGTPAGVMERLNSAINKLLITEEMANELDRLGYIAPRQPNPPDVLQALVAQETERWTAILRMRSIFPFH
ncbi:Bug family tripartite tricarboxylate transporter substrate binding protein [Achromobacter aloeverae]|uniref:MFS transporter n=1 Tax=Achromobacter aloeverae TaxID=1750518 RepID=A0A4Q1HQP6_9BURK|nr:tripartite tricarboxylate transporter substrate-binding protein [Achromobacter aloeverae]RXN93408.1 MFS transporter [Achromobacter aloeverae]